MTILKLLVFCVFFVAGQVQAAPQNATTLVASVHDLEHSAYDKVNAHRQSKGLPNLEYNEGIADIARKHSENMANGTVPFGHEGVQERYEEIAAIITTYKVAENVGYAWRYSNPDEIVVQGWIKSDGHRKNMEGDYNVTGIGVAVGSDGAYYFTQMFAKEVK